MYVVLFVSVLLFFSGCSLQDENIERLKHTISEEYASLQPEDCTLDLEHYSMLYGKPEFEELRDKELCFITADILHKEEIQTGVYEIEFNIVKTVHGDNIESFFRQWDAMEKRLKEVTPRKLPHPDFGAVDVYIDPVDNLYFVTHPDSSAGIEHTQHWHRLQTIKNYFVELRDQPEIIERASRQIYEEDDSWTFVTD